MTKQWPEARVSGLLYGGDLMFSYLIPWWVALIALFAGGIIGFVITILAIGNGRSDPRE